ncbi:MAG: DUF1254 domain-containing protein [Deltaproteobacteria bacterium]|nr:DUF1254 domain-containing protein [Deltaproteobacteria bacterium]
MSYVLPFIDPADGPWVAVMPAGEVRGTAHDMWQMGIMQLTKPGKYLFVGSGQTVPEKAAAEGYTVHQYPAMSLLLGIRLMATNPQERLNMLTRINRNFKMLG